MQSEFRKTKEKGNNEITSCVAQLEDGTLSRGFIRLLKLSAFLTLKMFPQNYSKRKK